jgi:hypothetical protein
MADISKHERGDAQQMRHVRHLNLLAVVLDRNSLFESFVESSAAIRQSRYTSSNSR